MTIMAGREWGEVRGLGVGFGMSRAFFGCCRSGAGAGISGCREGQSRRLGCGFEAGWKGPLCVHP